MPMVIKIITDGIDIQTQTVWFGGHILFSPVFTYTKVESARVLIMQLQEWPVYQHAYLISMLFSYLIIAWIPLVRLGLDLAQISLL